MIQPALRSRSIGGRLRRFFLVPAGPEIALEFSSVAIIGARVESKRGKVELRSLISEPLGEGAFVPTLEDPGFVNKDEIRDAAKRVLARIGAAPQARAAIVVPDVPQETPAVARLLEQFLREPLDPWQVNLP